MAHVAIDIPGISQSRKKELIMEVKSLVADIAEIDEESISVSIHELPVENMNSSTISSKQTSRKEDQSEKKGQEKKKSIFKEMFP